MYEQYAGRLLALCLRYVSDRETAEDLLHDGFIKIFGVLDKFTWQGEGSLFAWMTRVMTNIVLGYLRKNAVMNRMGRLDDEPDAYDEPDEAAVERVPEEVLMRFIRELPTGYRTVFNLYVIEEKTHKEIALLLGINDKSSASQLVRARALLAKKVQQWLDCNT